MMLLIHFITHGTTWLSLPNFMRASTQAELSQYVDCWGRMMWVKQSDSVKTVYTIRLGMYSSTPFYSYCMPTDGQWVYCPSENHSAVTFHSKPVSVAPVIKLLSRKEQATGLRPAWGASPPQSPHSTALNYGMAMQLCILMVGARSKAQSLHFISLHFSSWNERTEESSVSSFSTAVENNRGMEDRAGCVSEGCDVSVIYQVWKVDNANCL